LPGLPLNKVKLPLLAYLALLHLDPSSANSCSLPSLSSHEHLDLSRQWIIPSPVHKPSLPSCEQSFRKMINQDPYALLLATPCAICIWEAD